MPEDHLLGSDGDLLARQLFLDPRRLARTFAPIVQLGATDIATTFHFNGNDQRGIGLESPLDAFAGRNLAHGERRIQATVALGDDDTLVSLQTLAIAFLDLDLDDDGVARREVREGFAQAVTTLLSESPPL